MTTSVTPRAGARVAPATVVAHLEHWTKYYGANYRIVFVRQGSFRDQRYAG
jgi:hypothetical protein